MALNMNGVEMKKVFMNGVQMKRVFMNGVQIYTSEETITVNCGGNGFSVGFSDGSGGTSNPAMGSRTPTTLFGHIIRELYSFNSIGNPTFLRLTGNTIAEFNSITINGVPSDSGVYNATHNITTYEVPTTSFFTLGDVGNNVAVVIAQV